MTLKERYTLIKDTTLEFIKEKPMAHGAALAYYVLLALVPMLYLSVTYIGMFLGQNQMVEIISTIVNEYIGIEDLSGLLSLLENVNFEKGSVLLQTIGIIALLFSCAAIFSSIKRSLNEFYDIELTSSQKGRVIISTIVERLITLSFVVGGTLLLLVLYFMETIFLSLSHQFFDDLEMLNWFFSGLVRNGLPIFINTLLFTFIFKFLHDGKVKWKLAMRGGIVTAALLYLGQVLIKFYLNKYFFASGSGVAGTFLVILVWVYYSSQIIFFGAKYITVLARMKGISIQSSD